MTGLLLWFALGVVVGWTLAWLLARRRQKPIYTFVWSITHNPPTQALPEGVSLMADMQAGSHASYGVTIKDQFGNDAQVQNPTWSAEPPDVLTIPLSNPPVGTTEWDGKQLFATVQAAGKTGAGVLSFIGDADLGAGVKKLVGTVAINVLAGEAVSIELVPIEQPEVGPSPGKKK